MWFVGGLPVDSRVTALAALHWWNALRLATLHPSLLRSSALIRRAALNPYPILHRRQQHVAMETDDVTVVGGAFSGQTTPATEPETKGKCDSIRKTVSSPSFALA